MALPRATDVLEVKKATLRRKARLLLPVPRPINAPRVERRPVAEPVPVKSKEHRLVVPRGPLPDPIDAAA